MARFDLDPRETEFWAAGVRQLERRVDALEALVG
jgi:oligoendopeptidase F